eukprot:scaffold314611_cov33-Prasinocladus_malaysianus.AAC.1
MASNAYECRSEGCLPRLSMCTAPPSESSSVAVRVPQPKAYEQPHVLVATLIWLDARRARGNAMRSGQNSRDRTTSSLSSSSGSSARSSYQSGGSRLRSEVSVVNRRRNNTAVASSVQAGRPASSCRQLSGNPLNTRHMGTRTAGLSAVDTWDSSLRAVSSRSSTDSDRSFIPSMLSA